MFYTSAQIKEKQEDSFTAIASSEVVDRQGEVVEVAGLNLKNFKDNPILLWMHDHTLPIGKATRVWVDKTGVKPLLKFKGVISTATEYGRAAKQLVEEGIVNSFSIGFRADDMDGNRITKGELYEISLVTIPANPEARILALKSLKDAGIDDDVTKQFVPDLSDKLKEIEETANKALAQAEAAVKGLQYLAPQQRSMQEVVSKRLALSKVIVKTAEKLAQPATTKSKTVSYAKIIKRSSEKLIHDMKGDL